MTRGEWILAFGLWCYVASAGIIIFNEWVFVPLLRRWRRL